MRRHCDPSDRARISSAIALLIDILDGMDGDADWEDGGDGEEDPLEIDGELFSPRNRERRIRR